MTLYVDLSSVCVLEVLGAVEDLRATVVAGHVASVKFLLVVSILFEMSLTVNAWQLKLLVVPYVRRLVSLYGTQLLRRANTVTNCSSSAAIYVHLWST